MAKEIDTSKLVEISDDETSSSAISHSSVQGSTFGSANSTPSARAGVPIERFFFPMDQIFFLPREDS